MPRYPIVLFDLDGTLIDSIGLILDSYRHTMAAHALPPLPDRHWTMGIGTPLRAQLAPFATEALPLDALIATYREYNLTHHDARVTAFGGIVDAVNDLRALGCRLGIVTSKNRAGAHRGLALVGLAHAFELTVAADDVVRAKPDPEPVLLALEGFGAEPRQAVYVGDSVHDIHAGKAAGVATAAVLWGRNDRGELAAATPDHWVDAPADLVALVTGPGRSNGAAEAR
ncbi:MAG: HAD-IA family hydrolase [Gemmatimonadales bacterium]